MIGGGGVRLFVGMFLAAAMGSVPAYAASPNDAVVTSGPGFIAATPKAYPQWPFPGYKTATVKCVLSKLSKTSGTSCAR